MEAGDDNVGVQSFQEVSAKFVVGPNGKDDVVYEHEVGDFEVINIKRGKLISIYQIITVPLIIC